MIRLPLYAAPPRLAVEQVEGRGVDAACRRCSLGGKGKVTCLPGEGEPGGLLVVSDAPGREEEASARPYVGKSGAYLRQLVGRWWKGPVAWDYAVRCPASGEAVADAVPHCRSYLAGTVAEVRPARVLAFGAQAIHAVLGRALAPLDVRRGYAWLGLGGPAPVPVFFLASPVTALRNRIIKSEWFEPDVRWALTADPPVGPDSWRSEYADLETPAEVVQVLARCRKAAWTSVDAEWSGYPFDRDHTLVSVSLTPCDADGKLTGSYVIGYPLLAQPEVQAALAEWVADPAAKKVGSNLKADSVAFRSALGVVLAGQAGDTRFLRKLLESDAAADLATMATLVGLGGHKDEMDQAGAQAVSFIRDRAESGASPARIAELIERVRGVTGVKPSHVERVLKGAEPKAYRMAFVDPQLMRRYNARDTWTTALLHLELKRRLAADDPGLGKVWREVALPVAEALGHVESWGMPIDRQALAEFGQRLSREIAEVSKAFAHLGPEWNPDSSADVADLLFTRLGIKPTEFTATGKPSTTAKVMEEYAKAHPIVGQLLRYRELRTMKTRYADGEDGDGGLLVHVRDDGRIHPSINPDGTRTGRTSAKNPNLQNITRGDTIEGRLLRDCFKAPPGWKFVELDHSQLELRIAADQCGDPEMLGIFHSGEDYHLRTARMIAPTAWPNVDPRTITKDSVERTLSKSVNFGVLYDDSPYGLAFRLGLPVAQATKIRDALFGKFKKLGAYIQDRVKESARSGTARTWWNGYAARRRWLTELTGADEGEAKTARRASWNTPIQGTGSEYLVAGLRAVVDWINSEGVRAQVCVPIHDSILALVHEDDLAEYLYTVPRLMTRFPTRHGVPLVVDGKVGTRWGSMEKVKLD